MKRRFGRNDVLFLGIVVLLALAVFVFGKFFMGESGSLVTVTIDGKVYGTYPLDKPQTIPIKQQGKVTNILQIKDHKAKMKEADCPDQLCVHQSAISKSKQTIVCLPNKVVAEVQSTQTADYDAIVK